MSDTLPPELTPAPEAAEPPVDVPEIESRRNSANADAELHRRKRDELNDRTKEWVQKRDFLNAQVRELVEKATKHRMERDRLNEEVRKAKEERDHWNRAVSDLTDRLTQVRRRKMPRGAVSVEKLRRDLRALEFRQQTSVLTVEKERDLIDQMGRLLNEIKRREKEMEADEEMGNALRELREAKDKAEGFHKQVSELADQAQKEHDQMVALYEQGDALRREADRAQEEFIRTKMSADEEHRKHIEFIREVHDYDKILHGIRSKVRRGRGRRDEGAAVKREAELIFERFKNGEKLSTEDLMTLQKSGYL